ncbi:MAG: DNA ligase [Kiritimatiellae bacterium]|nr:DNA ligase [Kiritimatiellia bacterium]
MSRMNEMSVVIEELKTAAATINEAVKWLTEAFGGTVEVDTTPTPAPAAPAKPAITLEQVRAILAEKSHDGFTTEVRALLQKHGADKLSLIDPAEYESLMKDAEALGNG